MLKMGRSMLPLLILTTVALSSSDVLPILFNKDYIQQYNTNNQNDNIFSDRYSNNDIFKKRTSHDYLTLPIKETKEMYPDPNNRDIKDVGESTNKEQNYDDEGFRKEQWHNYPRQLDRLHNTRYKEGRADKVKSENEGEIRDYDDLTTNELIFDTGDGDRNIYDTIVADTNPFLILKVQLSYLRDDNNDMNQYANLVPINSINNEERTEDDDHKALSVVSEPITNLVKVKRGKPNRNQANEDSDELFDTENDNSDRQTVKKRIFSLWSRLQSLSHRGHELHHRRHLHAFYGSPDNNRNGIVTAQTRATFIRPPGSPLRWG